MQLVPRYLVKNRINVIANVAGFAVEYRPVYQREIQVYRNIDNVLEFRLLNADQKPVNTTNYTPKFVAFDESNNLIIERDGVVLDDGSSATKGLFTVTVTENDLVNVLQQFLKYNVYLVDNNEDKLLTYTNEHFGNDGIIRVNSYAFPGAKKSKTMINFYRETAGQEPFISDAIYAEPGVNGNEALHTAAVYTSGYTGTVTVQATLENQATEHNKWADIATLTFDGTETEPTPVNFNGVFSYIRFRTSVDPTDKITKVLVRN